MIRALAPVAALFAAACGGPVQADAEPAAEANAAAVATIDVPHLARLIAEDRAVLVDVRTAEEFAEGHLAGAINMPVDGFDPAAVPHEVGKQTVLYCRSGRRSLVAAEKLAATKGSATHLGGGILAWEEANQPVTTEG